MESSTNQNKFYYDSLVAVPQVKFEELTKSVNLLLILENADIPNIPLIIRDYFAKSTKLHNELQESKSVIIYANNDDTKFQKAFIYLEKSNNDAKNKHKKYFEIGSKCCRRLLDQKVYDFHLYFPDNISDIAIGYFLNAFALTNYKFERKGTNSKKFSCVNSITIVNPIKPKLEDMGDFLFKTSYYTLLAREMQTERANIATTTFMLERAKEVAENNPKIKLKYLIGEELQKEGLNLLYSVGKGSNTPPILATLEYFGNTNTTDVISIVGKGICFDSGGLNIKPTGNMEGMYRDKSGACIVLSLIKACSELNLQVNIAGIMAFAENSVSSTSYRASDIIKSYKGLTVEIGNTDAEGRLVLADAMAWTQKHHKPKILIELSTLTGACTQALGDQTGGIFTNSQELADDIMRIGEIVREPFWQLPITDESRNVIKKECADICSTGSGYKFGGASNAAAFLEHFVEDGVKWAHLDIAGPTKGPGDKGVYRSTPTGFAVRFLLYYLKERANI